VDTDFVGQLDSRLRDERSPRLIVVSMSYGVRGRLLDRHC
jgi:hypothetical protein